MRLGCTLLLALVADAGTRVPLSGDTAQTLSAWEAPPRPRDARWRARRPAPHAARPGLRGGSGEDFETKADDMILANVALMPHRRINRTALDLAVSGHRGSELVADRIDEASLLAQAGIDEEEIDRRMHAVLREYEDVDFSGEILCRVSRGQVEGGTEADTPFPRKKGTSVFFKGVWALG
jgi:hypothetical protein